MCHRQNIRLCIISDPMCQVVPPKAAELFLRNSVSRLHLVGTSAVAVATTKDTPGKLDDAAVDEPTSFAEIDVASMSMITEVVSAAASEAEMEALVEAASITSRPASGSDARRTSSLSQSSQSFSDREGRGGRGGRGGAKRVSARTSQGSGQRSDQDEPEAPLRESVSFDIPLETRAAPKALSQSRAGGLKDSNRLAGGRQAEHDACCSLQ